MKTKLNIFCIWYLFWSNSLAFYGFLFDQTRYFKSQPYEENCNQQYTYTVMSYKMNNQLIKLHDLCPWLLSVR